MARKRKNFYTFEEWCDEMGVDIIVEPGERDGFLASLYPEYRCWGQTEDEAVRFLGSTMAGKMFGERRAPDRWKED